MVAWVKVDERLPLLYETVLLQHRTSRGFSVSIGRLVPLLEWELGPKRIPQGFESDMIGSHGKLQIGEQVTHWMPVPEPVAAS
jgi:hypothetical protein